MNQNPEIDERRPTPETQAIPAEQPATTGGVESAARRALMKRYAKSAVGGGALLLFVSKAHAIHSPP